MLLSYARVSKTDGAQTLDLQMDTLTAAGIVAGHIYTGVVSSRRDDRPETAHQQALFIFVSCCW